MSAFAGSTLQIQIVKATNIIQDMKAHPNSLYSAEVVLPDGSHAEIICDAMAKDCGSIESFSPEKMPVENNNCETTPDATMMTCTKVDLGFYEAHRDGNKLTITVPNGRRRYHIVGSW